MRNRILTNLSWQAWDLRTKNRWHRTIAVPIVVCGLQASPKALLVSIRLSDNQTNWVPKTLSLNRQHMCLVQNFIYIFRCNDIGFYKKTYISSWTPRFWRKLQYEYRRCFSCSASIPSFLDGEHLSISSLDMNTTSSPSNFVRSRLQVGGG